MKIGIAIIHGIGRQNHTYADEFIERIQKRYQKSFDTDTLVFEPICWQQQIEPLENALFDKVKDIGWGFLRSLMIGYAGDAVCYQPISVEKGFYLQIHQVIDKALQNLASKLDKDSPLVVISHSLGSIVTSNFLWDSFKDSALISPITLELVSRIKCLYTMGSPLALWSLRYPNGGIPLDLREADWYNLYYSSDIIASPLKLINQHYNCIPSLEDVKIPSRKVFTGWNPMSHNSYWSEAFVINHIVDTLKHLGGA